MKEIINFGNGDIIVTTTINALIIKQIDRQLDVGEIIGNNSTHPHGIKNQFTLPINNYEELMQFKKLLVNAYQDRVFEYKHLTLDFSNYNRKSVDCILDQVNWLEKFIPKNVVV